jgi:PelA/Pel-15E family pectate lyase
LAKNSWLAEKLIGTKLMPSERRLHILELFLGLAVLAASGVQADDRIQRQRELVTATMKKAVTYFHGKLAVNGGYVYHYTEDLKTRWGEGLATPTQIWVQPPATPTVGMAFLKAYNATGDEYYLDAAKKAANALLYGQLKSGGWRNAIDFETNSKQTAEYRNGKGSGSNVSSLDDGQTQSAIRFLIQIDAALNFKDKKIHEATEIALSALLKAQYPNGGFPQSWTGPVSQESPKKANYPNYDWRTEGRVKNYWDMYTLNDNTCGYLADVLLEAYRVYEKPEYLQALEKLGDFLILAQMPEPQPGWAQQYSYDMQPIWARKFEPPGVSGDESQEAIETLMLIYRATNNMKYLEPIPTALKWLDKSKLRDNTLARYYELKTNRPLYMEREGEKYALTYDDRNLPDHYGWKTVSRIPLLRQQYGEAKSGKTAIEPLPLDRLTKEVASVVSAIDDQGRWKNSYQGERLVGQPKFKQGDVYLASEVFSRNLSTLAEFLERTKE